MKKTKHNTTQPTSENDRFEMLPIDNIAFSPFNYRKHINESNLQSFASELRQHGVLAPLMVRTLRDGRFELVAGERRLRAARLAGLQHVPVVVKQLTDEDVVELQLAENLQRENPHPLEEAAAINRMMQRHQSIDEIATRLGKSKQYVYIRIKLLAMINEFKELFMNDELSLKQAIALAALDTDGQHEVLRRCREETDGQWRFDDHNLDYYTNQCKYDLRKAPFNIKDKKLVPEKGACTSCPFNSATLKSLFPELAKEAVCTNKRCFEIKCTTQMRRDITNALSAYQPVALLSYGEPSTSILDLLAGIPEAEGLPWYKVYHVEIESEPEAPDKEDYTDNDGEFDAEGFGIALKDYEEELEKFESGKASGTLQKGLVMSRQTLVKVWFNPGSRTETLNTQHNVTAKEVQEQIKKGTVTPELLEQEIARLRQREERSTELDREKVQLQIHQTFEEQMPMDWYFKPMTKEDMNAARLLIYASLGYNARNKINDVLGYDCCAKNSDTLFDLLKNCPEETFAYLIRMAVLDKPESKNPKQDMAVALYELAAGTLMDCQSIENAQHEIAEKRRNRMEEKIRVLEKKIEKMKNQ